MIMEINPKISVVVPVYNVSKYLRRCVDSILKQEYENLEIILVDDGSTDDSSEICDTYSSFQNIKVYHKVNGGLSSARNYGINKASGDYISFIDSDDWISENYFSSFIDGVKRNAEIIVGDYTLYIDGANSRRICLGHLPEGSYFDDSCKKFFLETLIKDGEYMSVWRNLYSLNFLRENNLLFMSEREIYAEDDYFNTIAYSLCNHIYKSANAGYCHVIYKGSLSQSYRPHYFTMAMRRYNLKTEYLINNNLEKYSIILENQLPQLIANTLYKESLCPFSKAQKNIISISQHSYDVFSKYPYAKGRYKLQYFCARYNMYSLVVIISKLFKFAEPIYRFFSLKIK